MRVSAKRMETHETLLQKLLAVEFGSQPVNQRTDVAPKRGASPFSAQGAQDGQRVIGAFRFQFGQVITQLIYLARKKGSLPFFGLRQSLRFSLRVLADTTPHQTKTVGGYAIQWQKAAAERGTTNRGIVEPTAPTKQAVLSLQRS
jgi:hypothetical protein